MSHSRVQKCLKTGRYMSVEREVDNLTINNRVYAAQTRASARRRQTTEAVRELVRHKLGIMVDSFELVGWTATSEVSMACSAESSAQAPGSNDAWVCVRGGAGGSVRARGRCDER